MARNPQVTYEVNGIKLDDDSDRWVLTDEIMVGGAQSRRSQQMDVPGLMGMLPFYDEPWLDMPFAVVIGFRKVGGVAALKWRMHLIGALTKFGALTIKRTAYGHVSYADAKIVQISEAQRDAIGGDESFITSQFQFNIPAGCWRDFADLTWTSVGAMANGTTYEATTFAGCVGPMTDGLIRLSGQWFTPKITNPESNTGFTLPSITTGQRYIVNIANYTAHLVTTDVWTGGTDVSSVLTAFGQGSSVRPIMLMPRQDTLADISDTSIRLKVEGAPAIAATLELRGRRVYF